MFDPDALLVGEGNVPPAGELSELIVDTHRSLVAREGELVVLAGLWADAHDHVDDPLPRSEPGRRGRGPVLRCYGGEGTPAVSEFAADELGALLQTSTGAAGALMADALDLRHRLPGLWDRLRAGQVRAWQARAIAVATRSLSPAAALRVEDAVAPQLGTLPWGRVARLLAAAVIDADPDAADQRAEAEEAERFVRAGRASESGLKLLIARAAAGDVIWFVAMVDRIADILAADGDRDPVGVRRSKAIGILAQPAFALHLLISHQDDPDPAPSGQPARPEPPAPPDPVEPGPVEFPPADLSDWEAAAPAGPGRQSRGVAPA